MSLADCADTRGESIGEAGLGSVAGEAALDGAYNQPPSYRYRQCSYAIPAPLKIKWMICVNSGGRGETEGERREDGGVEKEKSREKGGWRSIEGEEPWRGREREKGGWRSGAGEEQREGRMEEYRRRGAVEGQREREGGWRSGEGEEQREGRMEEYRRRGVVEGQREREGRMEEWSRRRGVEGQRYGGRERREDGRVEKEKSRETEGERREDGGVKQEKMSGGAERWREREKGGWRSGEGEEEWRGRETEGEREGRVEE
ncbi:unnamed protein product [Pleuronectes platessa]|uniref:Uncharacterized protein n=1 Tax=Pleuronectes platessa TaxID=8262 RepID=A0A9N7TKB8_PLEPL|nr:unnamed protein product [Pleuronectes platessa]